MDILKVENLNKTLGKRQILKDVSFNINEGEILGLVGPNGAGKSTIIKCILGLYKPTSGTILINGKSVTKEFESALSNVSATIENPEVYEYMTAYENMMLVKNIYKDVTKEDIDYYLTLVKLIDRKNSKVKTYSMGMKQRLVIALALLSKPKLLILDEPTNGLDPLGIVELRNLLKSIAKEKGISILISSHILSEIELLCDRIAIINAGKIIEIKDGSKDNENGLITVTYKTEDKELLSNILKEMNAAFEVVEEGITLKTTKENLSSLNKYFISKDVRIDEVKINKDTLEDEFLKMTSGDK